MRVRDVSAQCNSSPTGTKRGSIVLIQVGVAREARRCIDLGLNPFHFRSKMTMGNDSKFDEARVKQDSKRCGRHVQTGSNFSWSWRKKWQIESGLPQVWCP